MYEKTLRMIVLISCGYGAISPATLAQAQGQSATSVINSAAGKIAVAKPFGLVSAAVHRRWWRDKNGSYHFDNGPRWVPQPRGASLKRAQELGLTSLQAIRNILRNVPTSEILTAAGNEKPRNLLWPVVKGTWGRGFGYTRKLRPELHHNGVDIGAPLGAPVRASAAGIVVYSDNGLAGFGNCVIIVHSNGWVTLYAHNLRNTVQAGWRVKRGERIALIGSTGASWGPHLHFEMRRWGNLIDPAPYFRDNRSQELNGPLVDLPGYPAKAQEYSSAASSLLEEAAVAKNDREPGTDNTVTDGSQERGTPSTTDTGSNAAAEATVLSARATERFLRRAPTEQELEAVNGRIHDDLLWPVRGGGEIVTRANNRTPRAVEIESKAGLPVRAAADGVVVYSGDEIKKYGNAVVLLHRNGWVTVYGSVQNNKFKPGAFVKRGTWIARTGETETQTSARLRFELREGGKTIDPIGLFVRVPPQVVTQ